MKFSESFDNRTRDRFDGDPDHHLDPGIFFSIAFWRYAMVHLPNELH